jgi:tetratricopeptide (TPR) repeat protein
MKLDYIGDAAVNANQLDKAICEYSSALSLNPVFLQDVLVKRSKAYIALRLWEDALNDANKVRAFVLRRFHLVDTRSLGDHAQSIVSMGLREEARSFTRGRML